MEVPTSILLIQPTEFCLECLLWQAEHRHFAFGIFEVFTGGIASKVCLKRLAGMTDRSLNVVNGLSGIQSVNNADVTIQLRRQ